jgi:hypothetical protein
VRAGLRARGLVEVGGGALARVVTYDSRGTVIDDHSLRDCTGGVDCEVR